ncbi:hypothetical protein Clacol_009812 [Clathrus columnatus]|uniref:Bifunctional polynucleotide phosphatase/kinase n=1 Tax=Clathrus columnatus TaxID=1419009 RepID=A0AAV5AS04_9AGAM|nr:hypothetical protein Clacol_009812 [Clathrus columnatus]
MSNKRKGEDDIVTQKSTKQVKSFQAIHPLFLKPSDTEFTWIKTSSRTFLHGTHLSPPQSSKVAAFDLDGVLIKPKSGGTYPKGRNDWMWWRPLVKDKLSELYEKGYTIAIFSNQGTTSQKTIDEWKNKIPLIAKELPNTPFRIFAAQGYDWYRKPMPGMWLEFEKINNVAIGDAAGRPGDHSDTDRKLALNIGLSFFTPEEFFLDKPPTPYKLMGFDIKGWPTDQPLFVPTSTSLIPTGNPSLVEAVLFVGYPASGKTTFYRRYFEPKGYKHINQDILKTRSKCVKAVEECLKMGEPTYSQRLEPYITTTTSTIESVASESVNATTLGTTTSKSVVQKGVTTTTTKTIKPAEPLPPLAFISYRANFEEPTLDEGFTEVKRINFIYEDLDTSELGDDPVSGGESTSTDRSKFWTKKRLWQMWLEIDKLKWMSKS